jgi:hypothetical protein
LAAGEDGVDGGAQVGAGDGEAVAGAAGVELAPVDEPAPAVEEEEVGRAGRPVGPGGLLGLVVEVGEGPALAGGLLRHRLRGVGRVGGDVVARDGHHGCALGRQVPGEGGQLARHVLDERAVVADEHDEQGGGGVEVGQGDLFAPRRGVGEPEIGGLRAEPEHGRRRAGHERTSLRAPERETCAIPVGRR